MNDTDGTTAYSGYEFSANRLDVELYVHISATVADNREHTDYVSC